MLSWKVVKAKNKSFYDSVTSLLDGTRKQTKKENIAYQSLWQNLDQERTNKKGPTDLPEDYDALYPSNIFACVIGLNTLLGTDYVHGQISEHFSRQMEAIVYI